MANLFNDKLNLSAVVGTSFDSTCFKPLRPKYVFESMTKEKTWNLNTNPNKGDAIVFTVLGAWSANTAALSPTAATIVGSQTLSKTRKSIAMTLYGDKTIMDTLELKAESFQDDFSDAAFNLADQAYNSMNTLVRATMDLNMYVNGISGTKSILYHMYASGGFTTATTAAACGPLKAKDVRAVVAKLRSTNVQPFADGKYRAIISSAQYTQLRADTENSAWSNSILYSDGAYLAVGAMGDFEGVTFFVSDEVTKSATYHTAYFIAPEFIGKAIGKDISVNTNPVLHGPFGNLMIMHWTALVGYGIIRREAGIIVESDTTVQ